MANEKVLFISVPASTANLGPGFDSVGLALKKYLTLKVSSHMTWKFVSSSEELNRLPNGKNHFIYQIAEKVAQKYGKKIPTSLVEVKSSIPLAKGLGSSAAAIIAGIELADMLCPLKLNMQEKLRLASIEEGHPDNVGASLYGGLIIGSHRKDETDLIQIKDLQIETVVIVPPYQVLTKDARSVLPNKLLYSQAIEASAISNVLIAALLTQDFKLAGKMMMHDLFHQPYRSKLMPDIETVYPIALENGAFGVTLSGAGPTLICFAKKGMGDILAKKMKLTFPHFCIEKLGIDTNGAQSKWDITLEKDQIG